VSIEIDIIENGKPEMLYLSNDGKEVAGSIQKGYPADAIDDYSYPQSLVNLFDKKIKIAPESISKLPPLAINGPYSHYVKTIKNDYYSKFPIDERLDHWRGGEHHKKKNLRYHNGWVWDE